MSGRYVYLRLRNFSINESSMSRSLTLRGSEDGSCGYFMLKDVSLAGLLASLKHHETLGAAGSLALFPLVELYPIEHCVLVSCA